MNLKIAAKVDKADREFFQKHLEPMIREAGPRVEFLGEIGGSAKDEFLGNAYALLFPIDWPEPFGLVMIEAMACGTPVIANRRGSVPEVMADGVTGFVVENVEEAIQAVGRVPTLDRRRCRQVFEERFSAERMTADYLTLYRRLVEDRLFQANGNGRANGSKARRLLDEGAPEGRQSLDRSATPPGLNAGGGGASPQGLTPLATNRRPSGAG
jgi:hypothetical protein